MDVHGIHGTGICIYFIFIYIYLLGMVDVHGKYKSSKTKNMCILWHACVYCHASFQGHDALALNMFFRFTMSKIDHPTLG